MTRGGPTTGQRVERQRPGLILGALLTLVVGVHRR
jgi:hypothetical protein